MPWILVYTQCTDVYNRTHWIVTDETALKIRTNHRKTSFTNANSNIGVARIENRGNFFGKQTNIMCQAKWNDTHTHNAKWIAEGITVHSWTTGNFVRFVLFFFFILHVAMWNKLIKMYAKNEQSSICDDDNNAYVWFLCVCVLIPTSIWIRNACARWDGWNGWLKGTQCVMCTQDGIQ